jgi:hypothetical protein
MILLVNDYSTKYWLNNDIKDCANNSLDEEIELLMDYDEKLKDNYNNMINNNNLNEENYQSRNINSYTRNRNDKNSENIIRSDNRYQNKNDRIFNKQKTNTHINIHRTHHKDNNKKEMYKLSSYCRISEYERRNILLDPYSKLKLKNIS